MQLHYRAHTGRVRALWWSSDDTTLLSCGAEGAVYQWRVAGLARLREFTLQVWQREQSPDHCTHGALLRRWAKPQMHLSTLCCYIWNRSQHSVFLA